MNTTFLEKIKADLKESQINYKVAILFIPIVFGSYLFHKFGYWALREIFGNEMV